MTNGEKYLKEDVDPSNLIEAFIRYYYEHKEEESDFGKSFVKYMNEKTKLTLTEDERVILRNIKSYDTIGRTESGYLIIRDRHTIPMEDDEYAYNSMYCFNHLFQFIKNGEEHEIKELLK